MVAVVVGVDVVVATDLGVHIVDVQQKLKRTCTHANSGLPLVTDKGMIDALTEASESSIFFLSMNPMALRNSVKACTFHVFLANASHEEAQQSDHETLYL